MPSRSPRDMREWMRDIERMAKAGNRSAMAAISNISAMTDEEIIEIVEANKRVTPSAPVELVVETATYISEQFERRGLATVSFQPVTKAVTGQDILVDRYELWGQNRTTEPMNNTTAAYPGTTAPGLSFPGQSFFVTPPAPSDWVLLASNSDPSLTVRELSLNSVWGLRVRAIGVFTVAPGLFSEEVEVRIVPDSTPPPQPTAPTVEDRLGVLIVRWDNLGVTGSMPADFSRAVLAMGTESSPTSVVAEFGRGYAIFPVLNATPYTPYYFRLRAEDLSGNVSPWSEQVVAMTRPLVDTEDMREVIAKAERDLAIAKAQLNANISEVYTSVDGKNSVYFSPTPPDPNFGIHQVGDTWFDQSNGSRVNKWDGNDWVPVPYGEDAIEDLAITDAKIANLTGDKILANTITAIQLSANSIIAGKIAADAVTAREIAALTITAAEIKALTITADKIVANSITSAQIDAGSIRAAVLVAESITGGMITATAIDGKTISGVYINGGTITGGIFQTKETGKRIVITDRTGAGSDIRFYAPTGTEYGQIQYLTVAEQGGGTSGADTVRISAPDKASALNVYRGGSIQMTGVMPGMYANGGGNISVTNQTASIFGVIDAMGSPSTKTVLYLNSLHSEGTEIILKQFGNTTAAIGAVPAFGGHLGMVGFGRGIMLADSGYATYIQSAYNMTTTWPANLEVSGDGVLRRSVSASRYKILPEEITADEKLLDVPMKNWIDLTAAEDYSKAMEAMVMIEGPLKKDDSRLALVGMMKSEFDSIKLYRVPGIVAEEVEAAGGEEFILYGNDGQVEGIMYDRFALLRTQLLNDKLNAAIERISELEAPTR